MAIRIKPVFSSTGTANRVAVFDPSTGLLTSSVVTVDELELLSGITGGDILTETNAKTVSGKTFNQDLVADANNEHDIGSSGVRWKDAYLAGQLNAATGDFSGNVTIDGDLTVSGTTTTLNTATLDVEDANIVINNGGSDASSEGAGLTVERTGTSGSLIYAAASATKFRAGDAAAEVDLVGTTSTQTLTNKTLVVASNTITTAASGNLEATELNAALDELQDDIDTRATTTALSAHISDAVDAHAASAITNTAAGTIVATTVQAAINELDGDVVALDGALDTHIADTSAHGATSANTASRIVARDADGVINVSQVVADEGNATDPAFSIATGSGNAGMYHSAATGLVLSYNGTQTTKIIATKVEHPVRLSVTGGGVTNTGIQLNNENTTGLYRIGANNWGFAASGTKVLDLAETAVGITPDLTVDGDIKSKSSLQLEDPGAGTNTITVQAPTLSGDYALTLPTANASGALVNDGSGTLSFGDIDLTADVTGVLPSANGGTGVNNAGSLTYGANDVALTTSGATALTLPTSGTVATLAGAEALTNKDIDGGTASDTSRITVPKNTKTNLDALTRKEGTVVYATDTAKAYVDDGSALIPIGSGSGGGGAGINLITLDSSFTSGANPNNFDFEDSADGVGTWAVYADTAATSPEDMAGGTAGTTIARVTSGELNGSASAQVDLGSGSSRQGEGWATSVHVPPAYRGRTLTCLMPYSITGAVVEDDLVPYCYDVTNSVLIKPYVKDKFLGSSGICHFTFPVDTDTAEVRVGVHIARTSTAALAVTFDDVQVSPFATPVGMAGSDWIEYTPTFTGFGTVSAVSTFYRQVGDSYEIDLRFTSGTATATEARVTLPNSAIVDATKVPSIRVCGYGQTSGTANSGGYSLNATGGNAYLTFGRDGVTGISSLNGSALAGSGDILSIKAIVPIAGKSANLSLAESSTYWISSYLANGTRVTGSAPTRLGEYRSQLRTASAKTYSDTNGTPTTAPTTSNGAVIYVGNTWATADASGKPSRYDIFVGKNKNVKFKFYLSTGRTGILDHTPATHSSFNDSTIRDIGWTTYYDETTGVATVVRPLITSTTNTIHYGGFTETTGLASGTPGDPIYFDIQVSENALAVGVQAPRSQIRVSTGNGHGSTNTKIRRFSTTVESTGAAITYADSATAGASFTVNEDGIYAISYSDKDATGGRAGLSLNSTELTSNIHTITNVDVLVVATVGAGVGSNVSYTGYFPVGSVIRPHTNGALTDTSEEVRLTIAKVGN